MKRSTLFWVLASLITVAGAYYQRVTGPTYPVSEKILINGHETAFRLERSHSSSSNYLINIPVKDNSVEGALYWKRYKTNDDWTCSAFKNLSGGLTAEMPKQPPAGKLVYYIRLSGTQLDVNIHKDDPIVIRFKGDVPLAILIPHILAMFGAMLLSTRTGLEVFNKDPKLRSYTNWTVAILIAGGMILGPITQLYAFGALWTGFPFGMDLTDNKTFIALIGWIAAAVAVRKSEKPGKWVLGASLLLLIVYSIPHSLFGSELKYTSSKS